ncbi:related to FAD1 |uniref:FAD synthase n=2 Tax=Melanopsichium pennsylvanicum TaxID=63383 RepID=A0AAJ5C6Q4_9BASI|nr:adenine nucleotide alpha hydrolases-like protein [Melanopsichium pennsylvanicum 4]SNX85768.1 related to FAD1 \
MASNGSPWIAPPSSSPPPQWIASIDSVYSLFEDPSAASQYPDLSQKVKDAVQLCEEVINQVGQSHCALSFNGGKDCTVLVHILSAVLRRLNGLSPKQAASSRITAGKEALPSIPSLYITCPSPFPTVEKFIKYCISPVYGYNLDLISVEGGMKQGIRTYLDGGGQHRVGISDTTSSSSQSGYSDEVPQQPREIKAMFVGTRRDDPHGPQLKPRSWTDKDWPRVERIHPILDWTYQDVWHFLRCPHLGSSEQALGTTRDELAKDWGTAGGGAQGVPYCLLYDQGYTSLGSTYNTLPNPELEMHTEEQEAGQVVVGDGTAKGRWRPAYMLKDGSLERAGRVENASSQAPKSSAAQQ